jgi:membrane peptidoglycan carboxypeptidase
VRIGAVLLGLWLGLWGGAPAWSAPPCVQALRDGTVCRAANDEAHRLFAARDLTGAVVIQGVETGAVVALGSFAREDEDSAAPPFSAATTILPLSVSKLFLAASVWTHDVQAKNKDTLLDVIVHSADDEGRRLAGELRKQAGTDAVVADLARYGMPHCDALSPTGRDTSFWSDASVAHMLVPAKACSKLDERTDEATWESALPLGEANFSVSLLHLSRFVQGIGNHGVMVAPSYRESSVATGHLREPPAGTPTMPPAVAARLRNAMLEVVESGTARGVKARVHGGWRLGGKTGTGPGAANPPDGIFVGLLFDPKGKARYTVAIYVVRGGKGGGAAAEIACDLFNYALGL